MPGTAGDAALYTAWRMNRIMDKTMIISNKIRGWGWLLCIAFLFGCAVMSWLLLNGRIPKATKKRQGEA